MLVAQYNFDEEVPGVNHLRDPSGSDHWGSVSVGRGPPGALHTATPLCDEVHVLVATPHWAERAGVEDVRDTDASALKHVPVVEVHESLPFVGRYWASVFDARPASPATVVAPDLRDRKSVV